MPRPRLESDNKKCVTCGKEFWVKGRARREKTKVCSRSCLRGELTPNWKGGRAMTSNGYVLIASPDHPHRDNRGYVREHRLVVEKQLGRYLDPRLEVHHLNGIKTDNSIENLKVMTFEEHLKLHQDQHVSKQVLKECAVCKKEFLSYPSRKNRGGGKWEPKYCSKPCYYFSKRKPVN